MDNFKMPWAATSLTKLFDLTKKVLLIFRVPSLQFKVIYVAAPLIEEHFIHGFSRSRLRVGAHNFPGLRSRAKQVHSSRLRGMKFMFAKSNLKIH